MYQPGLIQVVERAKGSFSVMVSRAGGTGLQLTERLKEKGIPAWYIPTLDIVVEEILLPVEDFQQAIFISANAVKYSVQKSKMLVDMLPDQLIAVGQGTANSLYEAGFNNIVIPKQFNSEGLLELPQLQDVTGQQILIVKGRGGRTLLEKALTKRGAVCHHLDVYCRVTGLINADPWNEFLSAGKQNIITIASVEAMVAINNQPHRDSWGESVILVVASERIKEKALEYGYQQIRLADTASNDAMMTAITQLINH